mgnify:CR=1 FL=1
MTDLTSIKNRFGIIGNSEALNRALEVALRVAPTDFQGLPSTAGRGSIDGEVR